MRMFEILKLKDRINTFFLPSDTFIPTSLPRSLSGKPTLKNFDWLVFPITFVRSLPAFTEISPSWFTWRCNAITGLFNKSARNSVAVKVFGW